MAKMVISGKPNEKRVISVKNNNYALRAHKHHKRANKYKYLFIISFIVNLVLIYIMKH